MLGVLFITPAKRIETHVLFLPKYDVSIVKTQNTQWRFAYFDEVKYRRVVHVNLLVIYVDISIISCQYTNLDV